MQRAFSFRPARMQPNSISCTQRLEPLLQAFLFDCPLHFSSNVVHCIQLIAIHTPLLGGAYHIMKERLCPWAALGLGVICLLFWSGIWQHIYDPATQLVHSQGLVGLFCGFVLLCALILLLLARDRLRQASEPGIVGLPVVGLRILAALLSVLAGVKMLLPLLAAPSPIPVILAVLLLLNGPALLGLAPREMGNLQKTLLLFPAFVSCYWLVAFYHQYGSCPSWVTYLWPMAAGLLAAWGWISYASRIYQPRKWDATVPLALVCVLVLCPSLAAPLSDGYRLSLAAQLVWFWSVSLEREPVPSPM